MAAISTFYGIQITMYAGKREHPPPHFHARYGSERAVFSIATGEMINGGLNRRSIRHVQEWWRLHQAELGENWRLARADKELNEIAPL